MNLLCKLVFVWIFYLQDVIESCPKALVDMALQNRAMERDIQKQELECAQLERTVTQLTENIQVLLRNPKTDVKQQLFPQFYSSQAMLVHLSSLNLLFTFVMKTIVAL